MKFIKTNYTYKLINIAFIKEVSAPIKYSDSDDYYYTVTMSDDSTHKVDENDFIKIIQQGAKYVPAGPEIYFIRFFEGKVYKETPVVAWKIDDGQAKPIGADYPWNTDAAQILFSDGRIFDFEKESLWENIDKYIEDKSK